QRSVGNTGRILALGEELPPNTLMRYGLADIRNYDSIELRRSLDWFEPLYESSHAGGARSHGDAVARTSRRAIRWDGVLRARERLREASVRAVVSPTPPPPGIFNRVDRVGSVWVARLDGRPLASASAAPEVSPVELSQDDGLIRIKVDCAHED